MNAMAHDLDWLNNLLDRHGADFNAWPDADAARAARKLVLSDREAYAALNAAKQLDALMFARVDHMAAEAEEGGLAERVGAAVLAALPALSRGAETRRWVAGLAASFILAVFLGGAIDHLLIDDKADEFELVAVESLLYGPTETDLR